MNRCDWGQQSRSQDVKTPWGMVRVWGNTRVPRLAASKRVWDAWFRRFIENRPKEPHKNSFHDNATVETYLKWRLDK